MMRQKKLILINPVNPTRVGLSINRSSRFPPLGLGIIAALTPPDWDVELIDENWEPFIYREADLVGITAFTASANRAYEIAAIYRQHKTPVVAGGIHVSVRPDEALNYVDAVVIGEAESVWAQLLSDVEEGRLQPRYSGGWKNLSGLPSARRKLFHPGYMFASVQTSRGCPMDCDFCSVTAFNGRRYRRRPAEEVLDEISTIPQKMLFFVDDNIIGYGSESRDQALSIFRGMVKRKMSKWWFCQASLNFADDEEVLYWAGRAGCKTVFLGLEAENEEALQEANKKLNLSKGTASYKEIFRRINKHGIAVLGAFIYGMDHDTKEAIAKRCQYIVGCGLDVVQTTVLTPLPGTKLFERLLKEERLLYTDFPMDWNRYDMSEVLHLPAKMSPEELEMAKAEADQRLFTSKHLVRSFVKTILSTGRVSTGMWALSSNLNYKSVWRENKKMIE